MPQIDILDHAPRLLGKPGLCDSIHFNFGSDESPCIPCASRLPQLVIFSWGTFFSFRIVIISPAVLSSHSKGPASPWNDVRHFYLISTKSKSTMEILVHVAAPAKAVDDVAYRTLARAYLDFEPASRISVHLDQTPMHDVSAAETSYAGNSLWQVGGGTIPSSSMNGGVVESPNISFRSAFGNLDSPRLRQLEGEYTLDSQLSFIAPPSVIQDSLPENNLAISQYCSPTRILEHYLSAFDSSQSDSSPVLQRRVLPTTEHSSECQSPAKSPSGEKEGPRSEVRQHTQPAFQSIFDAGEKGRGVAEDVLDDQLLLPPSSGQQTRTAPPPLGGDGSSLCEGINKSCQQRTHGGEMVIPLSPVVNNKRRRSYSAQPSMIDETRIASSYPSQPPEAPIEEVIPSSITRADSEPPTKRPRCSPAPVLGNILARSSSDIAPRQDRDNAHRGRAQPPQHLQTLHHLEVVAPDPPVSLHTLQPKDVITDAVAKLARQLGLKERFQPQSQSRPLRPFERGYWLIDCSSWAEDLKQSAWLFITQYVESGSAGWGVSCTRDKAFTRIRLYCFGCVVGHMYLVIYLMSQRKMLEVGMSWVAADGKPILVMASKPQKVKDGTRLSRG